MRRQQKSKMIQDFAKFIEIVTGKKPWASQLDFIRMLQSGKKVQYLRPNGRRYMLHLVNNKIVGRPIQLPNQKLTIFVDEGKKLK